MSLPQTAALAASMLEDNLVQNGQVGRIETKILTYNGGYDGQESFISVDELEAVRIGDVIDPATIVKLTGVAGSIERELPGYIMDTQPSEKNIIALIGYELIFAYIVTGENAYDVSAGTYAVHHNEYHVSRIETEIIHPINQKYLPESSPAVEKLYKNGQVGYSEKIDITWDGHSDADSSVYFYIEDGVFVKLSDHLPKNSDLIGGTIIRTNRSSGATETFIITDKHLQTTIPGLLFVQPGIVIAKAGTYGDTLIIPENGIYFLSDDTGYISSLFVDSIKTIDSKYLPIPKEIRIDDYDISLYTAFCQAAVASDGKYTNTYEGTKKLWEELTENSNYTLIIEAGNSRTLLQVTPGCLYFNDEGFACGLSLNLQLSMQEKSFTSIAITLSYSSSSEITTVYCAVTSTIFE